MKKISGIYKIEDKESRMIYIGLSTNLTDRWRSHLLNFLCGQGINKYHPELKLENLSFSILELCDNDKLDEREKYWISYYDSFNNGFNRTTGGRSNYVIKLEEETEVEVLPSPPALETRYFSDTFSYIQENFSSEKNTGVWCYSPWIKENQKIVELANNLGFSAIELHSANNKDFPLNEEQKLAIDIIETSGMVPLKYNFVVVNKAFARGFNLHDKRFNQLIVNSTDLVDREQARRQTFEVRCQHFKTLFPSIPLEYLNRWLSTKECRELADLINLPDLEQLKNKQNSRQMSWNKLKDYLPSIGYTVEKKRKMLDGKQQIAYFITGEWKEKKQINDSFMELVRATGVAS